MIIFSTLLFISGFLINDSFKSWDKEPVTTSIETLPISWVNLPGIVVCPPKGSHTGLNYDLLAAVNTTLTNEDRKEMLDLTLEILTEAEANMSLAQLAPFLEDGRPRNWLEGQSKVTLPQTYHDEYYGETNFYLFFTSATSGSVSTPFFGEDFDATKYKRSVDWQYEISVDRKLKGQYARSFMILELNTTILEENEHFYFDCPWGEVELPGNTPIPYKMKFPVRDFYGTGIKLRFTRQVRMNQMRFIENKQITGFSAKWYWIHKNEEIKIIQQSKYSDGYNKLFKELLTLVYIGASEHKIPVKDIKKKLMTSKRNWIFKNRNETAMAEKCSRYDEGAEVASSFLYDYEFYYDNPESKRKEKKQNTNKALMKTEEFRKILSDFNSTLKITIHMGNLNITDDILQTGYEMFIKLIPCPEMNEVRGEIVSYEEYIGLSWILFYETLFRTFPPRTVLQEFFQLRNLVKKTKENGSTISGFSIPVSLMHVLGKVLKTKYEVIDAVFSSNEQLLGKIYTDENMDIKLCIEQGDCGNLQNIMEIIGQ